MRDSVRRRPLTAPRRAGVGVAAARPTLLAAAGLLLAVGGLLVPGPGETPAWARDSAAVAAQDPVAARVRDALAYKGHRDVRASVGVWDAATGRALFTQDVDTARRTASLMKLATTGAALLALGPDHELTTEVRGTAEPVGGVLQGDLFVVGGGDPGFSEHLAENGVLTEVRALAEQVAASGVREVSGDLVLDTSAFSGPDRHTDWDFRDTAWPTWFAPVTALTINDGCLDVTITAGSPPSVTLHPPTRLVGFAARLERTASDKQHLVAFGPRESDGRIRLKARVYDRAAPSTTSLACVDPVMLFGETFRAALREAGVVVAGPARVMRGPPALPPYRREGGRGVLLARHATPLGDAIRVCNTRSQNLYAELILRTVGVAEEVDGSFEGGARAVRRVLRFAPDDTRFNQADGSGLSRANRATAEAVGEILVRMYGSSQRLPFMLSLAKPGDPEGTLRKRMRAARFRERVLAKTGTLSETKCLAGYVRHSDGVLAFAILCEGTKWRASDLQDAIVDALLER